MSNNIYDIMKKLNAVESIDAVPETSAKNTTLLESTMQEVLSEKYMGFKAVAASAKKGGAKDPEAVTASIGRKKYGKEKFQKAAAAGKKLGENAKLSERTWTDPETGEIHGSLASRLEPNPPQSSAPSLQQQMADQAARRRQSMQQPAAQPNYSNTVPRDSSGNPTQSYIKQPSGGFPGLNSQSQYYPKTDTNVMNNALKQSSMNKLANMAAQDAQMRAKELSVKEDDMEEGNLFTGAKKRATGKKLGKNAKLIERPSVGSNTDLDAADFPMPGNKLSPKDQYGAIMKDVDTVNNYTATDSHTGQIRPTVRNQGPSIAIKNLEKDSTKGRFAAPGLGDQGQFFQEDDMEEGNLFTGNLAKARAAGKKRADLDGDGDMETVKEQGVAEAAKYRDPKYLGKLHAPDAERQEREREEDDAFNAWVNSTDDFIDPVFQPDIRSHDEKVPLNRQGKPYEKDPLASRKDVRGRKDKTGVKRPFKADLKAAIRQGLGKHNLKGVLPEQGVAEGSMPMPKLPRRHFFDTWGEKGNGIAYTDNTHWWKIINGKIVDFTNSYEGTKEWKREFVARQKQGVAEGSDSLRGTNEPKKKDAWGEGYWVGHRREDRDCPYPPGSFDAEMWELGYHEGNKDRKNEMTGRVMEEKKTTKSGTVHKAKPGRYGGYDPETDPDKDEDDKKSEPAVKRGRGRPKKNADSDTGEVKKWDTSALQSAFGSNAPKKLPGKASVKHKMKDDDKDDKLDEVAPPEAKKSLRDRFSVKKQLDKLRSALEKYSIPKEYEATILKILQDISVDNDPIDSVGYLSNPRQGAKIDEVAPPGKKAERMVKNIKKGYSKDGKLTDKEKGIAYATTWKAHNKGKVEESIPPGFPKSLAKKIYEQCDGDMKNTLFTMWKVYNSVMESKNSSKKKISEGMKFEQSTTKPAMGTYKGGVWTADPPKKGEVGAPVPSPDEGAPVKQQSKRRPQKEDVSENKELNDVLKLAGMVEESVKVDECGMSPISGAYGDTMQDSGRMSINTNMSTDGNKTVTITADGDSAVELMQMLKMAGMDAKMSDEDTDIEKMSEEKDDRYEANTTPEEEVLPVQTQLKGGDGEVAGKEKKMTPHGYKFADNPMAMSESMTLKLMKEYESIKKTK
jgi:hypothetical protein